MEQINGLVRTSIRNIINWSLVVGLCCMGNCSFAADCIINVQPIKQGQQVNCDGFLFSPQAESEAHKAKEIADLQRSENEILEQRLKLYMDTTSDLSKDIVKRDSNESYIRLGYFVLGVLATGLVVRNLRP